MLAVDSANSTSAGSALLAADKLDHDIDVRPMDQCKGLSG